MAQAPPPVEDSAEPTTPASAASSSDSHGGLSHHKAGQPDDARVVPTGNRYLVLGTAGLPHILIRFYTVPTAKTARKSVNWAIGLIGAFYLMTLALGFGAGATVSPTPPSR